MSYKVLVAEDETIIRRGLICSIDWQDLDCNEVWEAEDGQEAIEKIKELCPDIVIIDINMPIVNGLKVLEQTFNKYEYVPIIITGYSEFEYAKEAIKFGVQDYLLKPLNLDELKEAIEKGKIDRQRRLAYAELKKQKSNLKNINILDMLMDNRIQDDTVKKMLDYIKKNYQNKITMHDLSEYLNYSETFLIKKFKEELKMNFSKYLSRYRIQRAIWMMKNTDKSLYNISEACGFNEYKYFNTVFKKYIGCSPSEFMRIVK